MTAAYGIDVSKWQPKTPNLEGLDFLFARATYGTDPDYRYAQHTRTARGQGLVVGAYHFGRNSDGAAQARAFLKAAGDADLYALDWEKDGDNPPMTKAQAKAFVAAVQKAGKRVGLYRSESAFVDVGQDWNWVANWADSPKIPWKFWQYGVHAMEPGGPRLDLDRFNGSPAELRDFAGVPMKPLEITSTAEKIVTLTIGDQVYNPDGTPLVKMTVAAKRKSPYGATIGGVNHRLIHVTTGGVIRAGLVRNADVTITDPPADPTPYSQADIDALQKAVNAKNASLRLIASEASQAAT